MAPLTGGGCTLPVAALLHAERRAGSMLAGCTLQPSASAQHCCSHPLESPQPVAVPAGCGCSVCGAEGGRRQGRHLLRFASSAAIQEFDEVQIGAQVGSRIAATTATLMLFGSQRMKFMASLGNLAQSHTRAAQHDAVGAESAPAQCLSTALRLYCDQITVVQGIP